jgi:hypothetical protein
VVTYVDASGALLGTPRVIDDRSTGVQRRRRIGVREHAIGSCAAPARVEKQNREAAYLLVVQSSSELGASRDARISSKAAARPVAGFGVAVTRKQQRGPLALALSQLV